MLKVLRVLLGYPKAARLARWFAFRWRRRFTLLISDNEELYYVRELCTPNSAWMAFATYMDFPPPEEDHERGVYKPLGFVIAFDNQTYWRACLPFNYWKISTKLHRKRQHVPRSDKLVQDYIALEKHNAR